MCGIVGCNWRDPARMGLATDALAHRGPDDAGVFVDDQVSLGHRRLSILDLTPAGHQPMFYDRIGGAFSERYGAAPAAGAPPLGVVYNGEIYNFMEVRADLERLGFAFTTRCDTEVILAAYRQWGADCFRRFNGMWALCLYDRERHQLVLSRDRMGVKPLYFHAQDKRFVFGSELNVFHHLLGRQPLAPDSLAHYLAFGFTPPDSSMFAGIEKLRPGEVLVYDLAAQRVDRRFQFWELPWPTVVPQPGASPHAALRSHLDAAVQRRLVADVPVGAFLSGGVDSSIIVALMRPHVRDLKTFSVRFDHPAYDESEWSRLMAERLGTDHHEIPFGAADVGALLTRLPDYFDDPLGDPSMVPTFLVSQVARRHVAVSLSGTGGDELFAGYSRFREYALLRRLRQLPAPLRRLIPLVYRHRNPDRARKLAGLLEAGREDLLYALLFSPRFRAPGPPPVDVARFPHLLRPPRRDDPLQPLLDFEQRVYLPENLLVKEDRASMAHGLEARVPFLDYTVVEFANRLHPSWKLRGRVGKYVLKAAFADVLPAAIANRPKRGFGFPLAEYLRGALCETAREILFDAEDIPGVERREVESLWEGHQSGRSDFAHALWCILMLNLWRQRWLS